MDPPLQVPDCLALGFCRQLLGWKRPQGDTSDRRAGSTRLETIKTDRYTLLSQLQLLLMLVIRMARYAIDGVLWKSSVAEPVQINGSSRTKVQTLGGKKVERLTSNDQQCASSSEHQLTLSNAQSRCRFASGKGAPKTFQAGLLRPRDKEDKGSSSAASNQSKILSDSDFSHLPSSITHTLNHGRV